MESRRKLMFTGFVASSVDGRISLHDVKMPDWTSKEDWEFFQDSLNGMDAVVVGNNTYVAAQDRLRKRNAFVFLEGEEGVRKEGSVTFFDPARVSVRKLLEEYSRVAVLGGSRVYGYMFEQGMMDELFVTVEPHVFGRGKEMVTGCTTTKNLRLKSIKQLNDHGTILLHYEVVHVS